MGWQYARLPLYLPCHMPTLCSHLCRELSGCRVLRGCWERQREVVEEAASGIQGEPWAWDWGDQAEMGTGPFHKAAFPQILSFVSCADSRPFPDKDCFRDPPFRMSDLGCRDAGQRVQSTHDGLPLWAVQAQGHVQAGPADSD